MLKNLLSLLGQEAQCSRQTNVQDDRISEILPSKPEEKENEDDENLEKMTDSTTTNFK